MRRPCVCDKPGCRLCHLYHHDPRYTALWSEAYLPPPPATVPPVRGRCGYQDDRVLDRRDRVCSLCWVYGCEAFGSCSPNGEAAGPGVADCQTCPAYHPTGAEPPEPVLIEGRGTPADAVRFSAVAAALHHDCPGRFLLAYRGPGADLYDPHPRFVRPDVLTKLTAHPRVVAWADAAGGQGGDAFPAWCRSLAAGLGVTLPADLDRPTVHLTDGEKNDVPADLRLEPGRPYWVVDLAADETAEEARPLMAGLGDAAFVQTGGAGGPADGARDFRGRLGTRGLARLVYRAAGGVGRGPLLRQLCRAFGKPCLPDQPDRG